jgi:hypothetical protein
MGFTVGVQGERSLAKEKVKSEMAFKQAPMHPPPPTSSKSV